MGALGLPFLTVQSAAHADGCSPMMAYLVPGTWETSTGANPSTPRGILASVGKRLADDYAGSITVLYPAYEASAFDKGKTYAASEANGVNRTRALMERCPNSKTVLGGYSQGADVAGDIAWQTGHGRGPVSAESLVSVGLLADPKRGNSPVIGPDLKGHGIAGSRPGGYGAMAGRMFWLCGEKDLYCNVSGKNPFLAQLGKTLGSSTNGETTTTTDGAAPDLSGLTSDYSNVDLAGAPSAADQLAESAKNLQTPSSIGDSVDLASVGTLAQQLLNTFSPIADTQKWMKQTPGAASQLTGAKGTQTKDVLSALSGMDVPGIINTATAILGTTQQALGTPRPTPSVIENAPTTPTTTVPVDPSTPTIDDNTTGAPSTEPNTPVVPNLSATTLGDPTSADLTSLAASALTLASQVAPLSEQDRGALSTASQVLGTLRMDTIISQGMNVVAAVTSTDYAGIINNLRKLPIQLATGNIRGAHKTAGTLNNQFSPWVKMAAQIDYKAASQILAMIPDPSGYAQIAALVLDLMGNVDIIRLARNVGQLQEVAWQVVETGNVLALSKLLPIAMDLSSVALGVLSPGQKVSVDDLGAGATPQQLDFAKSVDGQDFTKVVSGLTQIARSDGAANLAKLVGDGLDAASFLHSGAHTVSYDKPIFGGRTATDAIYMRFRAALGG